MIRRSSFLLVLLASAAVIAQQGVDFLQAPDAPFEQELSYRFGITYQPDGGTFVRFDGESQQAIIVASHALQATLQLGYSISPFWTVEAFGTAGFRRVSEHQADNAIPASADWQPLFQAGAGVVHTFSGGGQLRPALHLQASYPAFRFETSISASLLRDPVLLRAMLGIAFEPSEPGVDLLAEVKTTFLANDVVSFGGSAGLAVPLTSARLTRTEIAIQAAYDYGRQVPAWMTTSVGLMLSGNNFGLSVSADIAGDKALQP